MRREDASHTGSLSSRCITLQGVHDHTVLRMVWTHTCTVHVYLSPRKIKKWLNQILDMKKLHFLCSFIGPYNICMPPSQIARNLNFIFLYRNRIVQVSYKGKRFTLKVTGKWVSTKYTYALYIALYLAPFVCVCYCVCLVQLWISLPILARADWSKNSWHST